MFHLFQLCRELYLSSAIQSVSSEVRVRTVYHRTSHVHSPCTASLLSFTPIPAIPDLTALASPRESRPTSARLPVA